MTLGTLDTGQSWASSPAGAAWNVRTQRAQLTTAATSGGGGAAASLRQKTNDYNIDGETGGTTATVTFPSSPVAGNLLVLSIASDADIVSVSGSGWTAAVSNVDWPYYAQWYKIAGASEPTSVTVTQSVAGAWAVTGYEFSGIQTSPLDKTAQATTHTVVTAGTGTTAATAQANELVVAGWCWAGGEVTSVAGYTNSFVEQTDQGALAGVWLATATKVLTSTGAQSCSSTATGPEAAWCAAGIATYKANAGGAGSVINAYATVDTGHAHDKIQVTVPTVGDNNGLVFRYVSDTSCWRFVADVTGAKWSLRLVSGSGEVELGSAAITPANGATIAVEFIGDQIACSVGGVVRFAVTNSTNNTATKVGITARTTTGAFDDFQCWYRTAAATVPAAPAQPGAVAGNAQATVNWNAPSNGGATIDSYEVQCVEQTTSRTPSPATATSVTFDGLTNGTSYTFRVRAHNSVGWSNWSTASAAVTPRAAATVPGAPTVGTPQAGSGQVTVNWSAPVDNGGASITSYSVTAYSSSGGTPTGVTAPNPRVTGTNATSYTFTGLTNGTAYTFKAAATNSAGTGAQSALSNVATPSSGTRDTKNQPFRDQSVFNLPIGANASYSSTNNGFGANSGDLYVADGTWTVWLWVSGTGSNTYNVAGDQIARLPSGVHPSPDGSGGDNILCLISDDANDSWWDIYAATVSGSNISGAEIDKGSGSSGHRLGDGVSPGIGAAQVSNIGGLLRIWDIDRVAAGNVEHGIDHTLAAGTGNSAGRSAYVWPAHNGEDASGSANIYMGWWYAIPPESKGGPNFASLGLDNYGLALAYAMRYHGIIIRDYTGGDKLYAEGALNGSRSSAWNSLNSAAGRLGPYLRRITNVGNGYPASGQGIGGGAPITTPPPSPA